MTPAMLRMDTLTALEETATAMLLNPEAPKRADELVGALEGIFAACTALMLAESQSNRGYEERDLSASERDRRKRIKHILGLLYKQHVVPTLPQEAS